MPSKNRFHYITSPSMLCKTAYEMICSKPGITAKELITRLGISSINSLLPGFQSQHLYVYTEKIGHEIHVYPMVE